MLLDIISLITILSLVWLVAAGAILMLRGLTAEAAASHGPSPWPDSAANDAGSADVVAVPRAALVSLAEDTATARAAAGICGATECEAPLFSAQMTLARLLRTE